MSPSNPALGDRDGSEAAPGPDAGSVAPSAEREAFSRTFDRCFDRVYAYVARRVDDRAICERVVRDVLEANLRILIGAADDRGSAHALKRSCNERIEAARAAKASKASNAV